MDGFRGKNEEVEDIYDHGYVFWQIYLLKRGGIMLPGVSYLTSLRLNFLILKLEQWHSTTRDFLRIKFVIKH